MSEFALTEKELLAEWNNIINERILEESKSGPVSNEQLDKIKSEADSIIKQMRTVQ